MGWIKAELSEADHEALREIVECSDAPTHAIAGEIISNNLEDYNNAN